MVLPLLGKNDNKGKSTITCLEFIFDKFIKKKDLANMLYVEDFASAYYSEVLLS